MIQYARYCFATVQYTFGNTFGNRALDLRCKEGDRGHDAPYSGQIAHFDQLFGYFNKDARTRTHTTTL